MERDPESVPGDVSTKSARVEMTVQSTMQYHCCELKGKLSDLYRCAK